MATIGKRSINWNQQEELSLVEAVRQHDDIIEGRFTASLTKDTKKKAWDEIADQVNRDLITTVYNHTTL